MKLTPLEFILCFMAAMLVGLVWAAIFVMVGVL